MKRIIITVLHFLLLATAAWGQGRVPLRDFLFPPELVMRHQQELGLSDAQREQILSKMEDAGAQFARLRWDLEAEVDGLRKMLESPRPDERTVLDQLDVVLDLERQIKRTQLALAVRIKSVLDEEQLRKLESLRRSQRPRFGPGGPPGPGPGGPRQGGGPGGLSGGGPAPPGTDLIFP